MRVAVVVLAVIGVLGCAASFDLDDQGQSQLSSARPSEFHKGVSCAGRPSRAPARVDSSGGARAQ